MSLPNRPCFHDETAAYTYLEGVLWPNGPTCPHCGNANAEKIGTLKGKSTRPGVRKCYECRKPFTVKIGTIYESSHIPLHKWLQATLLMCASKKGISAHQLHLVLEITYKSAWFMAHRIREAMRTGDLTPMGGDGKTVEADETFIGGRERNKHANKKHRAGRDWTGREPVFSPVERGGHVRSRAVKGVSAKTLRPILTAQIDRATKFIADDAGPYRHTGEDFDHAVINHGIDEYVRGSVHTNTIESYVAVLKRGITGTYHHASPWHLKRYLAEFDFRYNEHAELGVEDAERTTKALVGSIGKRLTYRDSSSVA